jgi:hypothetical protein
LVWAPAARAKGPENMLSGLSELRSHHVRCVKCLADGVASNEGDHWKTTMTTRFADSDAFVDFDLGRERKIRAGWLQGDNNDTYEVLVSRDGNSFTSGWRAGPVGRPGMQARQATDLDLTARYVRIRATTGDGSFAVSEAMLFEQPPSSMPPLDLVMRAGTPLNERMRHRTLLFGLGMLGWLALTWRRAPRWWVAGTALWPLITGLQFIEAFFDATPVDTGEISLVRAVVATVAAAAVAREAWGFFRREGNRAAVLSTLGVCGVVGALAFWNLGQPQFWHAKQGDWTFVHHLDLRQYYNTAKYFPEIGYRGLYEADMAAYMEDNPRARPEAMARTPMRDLDTLKMTTVGDREWRIKTSKQLFSPQRWEEYKRDSAYFRDAMGTPAFLDTMHDMGGNATPVWMSIAHLLFNSVDPSNKAFLLTGLLDPLLLGGCFIAIALCFGLRTAFVCMVIFGANDYIMYGSNWGGATLRHDWMAYLGFGACALKRRRYMLGGAFLGLSAMIRAFPALAIFGATLPGAWWLFEYLRAHRRLPGWSVIKTEQRHTLMVIAGALLSIAALFAFSAIVLPMEAWVDWLAKVRTLTSDPHANHISLRSLIAGWGDDQARVLRARLPLYIAAVAFFALSVFIAARRRPVEQSAMLALILIPVLFYPANYYIHFVFLLPLVVAEDREAVRRVPPLAGAVFILLLGMCAVQYFTVPVPDRGLHFYMASAVLFSTLILLVTLLIRGEAAAAYFALQPAPSSGSEVVATAAASPAPGGDERRAGGDEADSSEPERPDSGEQPAAESEPEAQPPAKTGS